MYLFGNIASKYRTVISIDGYLLGKAYLPDRECMALDSSRIMRIITEWASGASACVCCYHSE